MTLYDFSVSAYTVYAYAGPVGNADLEAQIQLEIPNAFAYLRFYRDGVAIPANSQSVHQPTGYPMFRVGYRYAQFGPLVDILRHETPIRFVFNDVNLIAYLITGNEPVGENE